MEIIYKGPAKQVNVAPYYKKDGPHVKDAIRTYPDEFGGELIKSQKQKFEVVQRNGKGTKGQRG